MTPAQELPSSERAFCCVQEAATTEDAAMARMFVDPIDVKKCKRCTMVQAKHRFTGRSKVCWLCRNDDARKKYAEDPEYKCSVVNAYRRRTRTKETIRNEKLWQRYKLTPEDYDGFYERQQGKCAICNRDLPLHVDHDHNDFLSAVRGLLCAGCNRGLGCFDDDSDRLISAAIYLMRFREEVVSSAVLVQ